MTTAVELQPVSKQAASSAIATLANGGKLRIKYDDTIRVDVPLAATAFDVTSGALVPRGGDGATPIGPDNPLIALATSIGAWNNYEVLSAAGTVLWKKVGPGSLTLATVPEQVAIIAWASELV